MVGCVYFIDFNEGPVNIVTENKSAGLESMGVLTSLLHDNRPVGSPVAFNVRIVV
jgi:hypothetical protein